MSTKRRQKKFISLTTKHLLVILPSPRFFKKPITESINFTSLACNISAIYADVCLTVITLKGQGMEWVILA